MNGNFSKKLLFTKGCRSTALHVSYASTNNKQQTSRLQSTPPTFFVHFLYHQLQILPNGTSFQNHTLPFHDTPAFVTSLNWFWGLIGRLAECIANEDDERQIACAVVFQGGGMVIEISLIMIRYWSFNDRKYIGSQALQRLVKNSNNIITGSWKRPKATYYFCTCYSASNSLRWTSLQSRKLTTCTKASTE